MGRALSQKGILCYNIYTICKQKESLRAEVF